MVMTNDVASVADPVSELLLRWEEAREQGQPRSAAELCASCPELVPELERRIRALESMEAALGINRPPTTASTPGGGGSTVAGHWHIPGYEVLQVLGEGGMGIVFKARQLRPERVVALKMVRAGPHARADQLARFRTEIEAAAQMRHANIVPIFEAGDCAGQPFFSMEYVDGGSLADRLDRTPQPAVPAARLIATLARAIQAAHQQGIIHRDLKPGNILLVGRQPAASADAALAGSARLDDCTPKITDFGLAKWMTTSGELQPRTNLTASGAILGTPSYLAPEQAEGKNGDIGPSADIYALGAILYELLTGRPPFVGESTLDVLEQVCFQEPVAPSRLRPRMPRDLETICLKCLAKTPGKRYASAADLADDLERFLAGRPIMARPTPPWEKGVKWARRQPALAALTGVSVVAIALFFAGWTWFTAQLHAEREFARGQERIAKEQERIAKENQQVAEEQSQVADQERMRCQTILDRSLEAIDHHAQITVQSKEAAGRSQWEPGRLLYNLARAYAATSATYRSDPELRPTDRQRLAEQYADRAVKLLDNARAAGFFARERGHLAQLKKEKDLDPIRSRPSFRKWLTELEAQAAREDPDSR
jgi:serine/threonine protein kinase